MSESLPKPPIEFVTLPFTYAAEKRRGIGIVAPYDFALDDECARFLPPNVPLYITRTARVEDVKVTTEQALEVGGAAAVIPAVRSLVAATPASVAYACTSGSFVGGTAGEALLRQTIIEAGAPDAVTTSGAALEALRRLGVTKLAIATPYNEELTQLLADFFASAGFTVVRAGYLNADHDIMHIEYDAVREMAELVNHPEAEAIFFSCTNLRTFDIIEELEEKYQKPILTANQVTMWEALRAAELPLPELNQQLFIRTKTMNTLPPRASEVVSV